jgi:2-oxoglutarate dehydrogenase E1 component
MNRLLTSRNILASACNTCLKLKNASEAHVNKTRFALLTTTSKPTDRAFQQPAQQEDFINGTSTTYIEEIYQAWLHNPSSVHKSWDAYFRTGQYQSPPTLGKTSQQPVDANIGSLSDLITLLQKNANLTAVQKTAAEATPVDEKIIQDHLHLFQLIRVFQVRGHKLASLDPLGILQVDVTGEAYDDLSIEHYNFSEADMKRKFRLPPNTFIGGEETHLELGEILKRLKVPRAVQVNFFLISSLF